MRRRWNLKLFLVFASLLGGFLGLWHSQTATAANPTTMSFQGKVVNADGTNVTDGTYQFVFKLYTVSSGGSAVWTETDSSVSVTAGVFQVNLGANCPFFTANACNGSTPIDFNANPSLYLGITFNSDPAGEMTPRVQLQSVPYAYNADKVGGLSASQLVHLAPSGTQGGNLNVQAATSGTVAATFEANGSGDILDLLNASAVKVFSVGSTGNTLIEPSTNSTAAFQIQNSGGVQLLGADTTDTLNKLTNPSFEVNVTTGWADLGTVTRTQDSSTYQAGLASMKLVTTVANSGARANSFTSSLVTNGTNQYTFSFYVKASGANFSTINIGYNSGGSDTDVCTGFSASTTGWTRLSCTMTPATGTGTLASVYIKDTGTHTFWVDSAQLESGAVSTGYQLGGINLGGVITNPVVIRNASDSVNELLVQNAAGNTIFNVDANDLFVGIGTAVPSATLDVRSQSSVLAGISLVSGNATTSTWYAQGRTTSDFFLGSAGAAGAFATDSTQGDTTFSTNSTSEALVFNNGVNSTASALSIQNSNVGIGIRSASTKLDVRGTTQVKVSSTTAFQIQAGASTTNLLVADTTNTVLGIGQTPTSGAAILQVTGSGTFNLGASNQLKVTSGTNVPTVDQFTIDNTGSTGVTAAGINGLSINYKGGAAAVEAGAARIDLQPGTTTGGTWNGLRVVPNATGAVSGVTENGLKIDNLTTPGAGTENALFVGTGWDNVLKATNVSITQAGVINTTGYQSSGTPGISVTCTGNQTTAAPIFVNGLFTSGTCRANGVDIAEQYNSYEQLEPGDVVATDSTYPYVKRTTVAGQTNVVGIVSTDPDQVLGGSNPGYPIALIGRVPTKVTLENGPIQPGDFLTPSSTPGYAMKFSGSGQVVGIALETYDGSQPDLKINVFVHLGYQGTDPSSPSTGQANSANDSVITPQLLSDGALAISSGSVGDVSIDTGSAAAVNIGTSQASQINLGHNGATTDVKGALVAEGPSDFSGNVTMHFSDPSTSFKIDNSGSVSPVDAAIQITDSASGYSQLIKTPNFNVAGNGDVTTNGSIVSKGGTFQILDPAGQQLISFDQNGNANFKGNLNLTSASLTGGLTVGGDVNVAGLSTFQKLATFIGKTVFRQDVEFDAHITVASDTAGYASLRPGETSVHVNFANPYEQSPIVSAAITNGQFASYSVDNVTNTGFDIKLQLPATSDLKFAWTALGVNNPQTASNPLPTQP